MMNSGQIEIRYLQRSPQIVFWLQGITLAWMVVECGVSLYVAADARSVALLAFGADSFVELLSASVVLVSLLSASSFTNERATRWAGILLFALAVIITVTAIAVLARGDRPEVSTAGIAITAAALLIMPGLAWAKRRIAKTTVESRPGGRCSAIGDMRLFGCDHPCRPSVECSPPSQRGIRMMRLRFDILVLASLATIFFVVVSFSFVSVINLKFSAATECEALM